MMNSGWIFSNSVDTGMGTLCNVEQFGQYGEIWVR